MTSILPNLSGLTILLSVLIVVVKTFSEDHRKLIEKKRETLKKEQEAFKEEEKALKEDDPVTIYIDRVKSQYDELIGTPPQDSSGVIRFGYSHLICFSLCYFLVNYPPFPKDYISILLSCSSFTLLCLVFYSGRVVRKMGKEEKKFLVEIDALKVDSDLAKKALERARKKRDEEDNH